MNGSKQPVKLFKLETRLPEETVDQLKSLAAANRRSVAAEIRVAVETRLNEAAAA